MSPTNNLNYLVQHLASVMSKQTDQLLQEQLGIGVSQYRILSVLEWSPRIQQKTIADTLGQTEASISRQVTLLIHKGLLVSKRDAGNRRIHIIMPTPMGMQLTEAATAIIGRSMGPEYVVLGEPQLQQLINSLRDLHHSICQPGKVGACDHALGS
jgi:DNA-binding MarR family transcriptional regulator